MYKKETKKLFIALVTEEGLKAVLGDIIMDEEYYMASDGGEPDLVYILIVRLFESMVGHKIGSSLVNSEEWRKHALKEE
jgi:hypothetical protein